MGFNRKQLVVIATLCSVAFYISLIYGTSQNWLPVSPRREVVATSSILYDFSTYSSSSSTKSTSTSTTTDRTTSSSTPGVTFARTDLFNAEQYAQIYDKLKEQPGDYPNTVKFNISGIFNTSRVTNEHKYNFIIKPKLEECDPSSQKKLFLLAIVMIGVGFEDKRQLIRSTWGNVTHAPDLKVIFAVALSRDNATNHRVKLEAEKYNDILQEDFIDDYFNITIKVIGAFKYFTENNCRVDRLMRINDDVVIQRGRLIQFLKNINHTRNLIIGHAILGAGPIRASWSKWFVREQEFSGATYFPYVEGSAFIVSKDLVHNMYNLSRYVYWPPFSISLEDVYIGMLCTHLQANYMMMGIEWYVDSLKPKTVSKLINNVTNATTTVMVTVPRPVDLYFVIAHDPDNFKYAWKFLNDDHA